MTFFVFNVYCYIFIYIFHVKEEAIKEEARRSEEARKLEIMYWIVILFQNSFLI